MADMMFDLVETRKSVAVTFCPTCKRGMSVVGIAFFVPSHPEQAAA